MSSSDNESSDRSDCVDDDLEVNAFDECVTKMQPYLKKNAVLDDFKKKLEELGLKNLSHISYIKQEDVDTFISTISFRQLQQKLQEEGKCQEKKKSTGDNHVLDLQDVCSTNFFNKLNKDEVVLTYQERKDFVHAVAADIRLHSRSICDAKVLREASQIVKKFPTSMGCLMKDDTDLSDASISLKDEIIKHARYTIQCERDARRKRLGEPAGKKRRKCDNFTKAQNFGLDPSRDLPEDLPLGETNQSQEEKRKGLVEINSSGESFDIQKVLALMKGTYVWQRIDINKKMSMETLLKRWPFIGLQLVLEAHFEYLMDLTVAERVGQVELKYSSLERFFEIEGSRKRKGKDADISEKLKKTVTSLRSIGKATNNSHRFIALIIGAMNFMKVPLDELFVLFTETTSFDEIQAHKFHADGRPVVAVLGSNPIDNPKAFVVVENRILSEKAVPVHSAILAAFMCYFVFKIEYPFTAASILYFLQSRVFKIHGHGHRTKRKRLSNGNLSSNPPSKPAGYLKFMSSYKEYCLSWNMQAYNDDDQD